MQGLNRVDQVGVQLVTFQLGHRVTQSLALALHTEGGHHHLVQRLAVGRQHHVERLSVPGDLLSRVSDVGDLDDITLLHVVEHELTVKVRDVTVGSAFHYDRRTDDTLTGLVLHDTCTTFSLLLHSHRIRFISGRSIQCPASTCKQEQCQS